MIEVRGRSHRGGSLALALTILGCAGAPSATPPPATVRRTRAPEAPLVAHAPPPPPRPTRQRVALGTLLEVAPTASGFDAEDAWVCRQTFFASPPTDARGCIADGTGITARVVFHVGGNGVVERGLERPLEAVAISDCGNRQRPLPSNSAALQRAAPGLASLPVPDPNVLHSCTAPELTIESDSAPRVTHRGARTRLEATDRAVDVRLLFGEEELSRWVLNPAQSAADCASASQARGRALVLEAECSEGSWMITAATEPLLDVCGEAPVRSQLEYLPCIADVGTGIDELQRWRIDVESRDVRPVTITAPSLITTR